MTTVERHGTAIAVAVFLVVALAGILARPLLPVDETRYLAVAWEMREGGHWLVPRLNGEIYSHKPPLLFWLDQSRLDVHRRLGVRRAAGRAGLRRRVDRRHRGAGAAAVAGGRAASGGRAALVLAGTLPFTLYAGLTMFDSMLTLATVLGMTVLARPGPRAWLWLGAALAFGAYAKGPVILIHLVPAALLAPLWTGRALGAAALRLAKAVGVGLVLVGLWLVPALVTGGEEYSPRGAVDAERRAHGRLLRPRARGVVLPAAAADPALAVDVVAAASGAACAAPAFAPTAACGSARSGAAATLLLFSLISGKQVHYLIPALPAAALVVARLLPAGARAPAAGIVPLVLGRRSSPSGSASARRSSTPRSRPTSASPSPACSSSGSPRAAGGCAGRRSRCSRRPSCSLIDLAFVVGSLGRLYDARPIAAAIAPHDGDDRLSSATTRPSSASPPACAGR